MTLLLFSRVVLSNSVTSWIAGCQASLFFSISQSLLKIMSIDLVMLFNHPSSVALFSSCPQSFQALGSFTMSQFFASSSQIIGTSASVLPMIIQYLFPLGLTGLISSFSIGLSGVFSSNTGQKHQFFSTQTSLRSNSHMITWLLEKTIALTMQTFVGKVMSLLLSRFVITFLPRASIF